MGDAGPLVRFAALKADPAVGDEILRELQSPGMTLRKLAKKWGVPKNAFLSMVAANAELSEACKRVRELAGVEHRYEGLEILESVAVDAQNPAASSVEVSKAVALAKYHQDLSRDLNRSLFGKQVRHEHTVTVGLEDRLRRALERDKDRRPALDVTDAEML